MAVSDKGPVGPKHGERLVCLSTSAATPSPTQSDSCFLGCDRAQIPTHRQLSIHPFFWYRRRQWSETGDQSKNLNTFVVTPHIKMEGIHTLKSLLRKHRPEGCIPISQKHRKYLCFHVQYQVYCLPFGLTSAPMGLTSGQY